MKIKIAFHLLTSITLLYVVGAAQHRSKQRAKPIWTTITTATTSSSTVDDQATVEAPEELKYGRPATKTVQQKSAASGDIYTDPCKAALYMGDIALTEDDAAMLLSQSQTNGLAYGSGSVTPNHATSIYNASVPTSRNRARPRGQAKARDRNRNRNQNQNKGCDSASTLPRRTGARNNRSTATNTTINRMKMREPRPGAGTKCPSTLTTSVPDQQSSKSRGKRAATNRAERLWEYGVIPYVIESNFSGLHKALFKQAMRHWENYTCITFVEKAPYHDNYILFTERNCGCCSFVGKRGNGAQAISIGKNCDKLGIVIHELGHVVGFWHEHTRPDRDAHVNVYYHNVMTGQEYNFNKLPDEEVNSLNEEYDYESIMHYSRNTFAKQSNLDTILPRLKPQMPIMPEIGQRVRLSPGDIRQTNKLYNCPSCGDTLMESSGTFSSHSLMQRAADGRVQPLLCQWRISGTHGERVMLNMTSWNFGSGNGISNARASCETDYVEVRDGNYVGSPLIGRFCGESSPGTLISSDSRMWIEYRRTVPTSNSFAASYEILCGGEITKESGQLSSPNYPDMYKPNKECVWKIKVPEGSTIALSFQTFEIEQHAGCSYDYLEIRDGEDENAALIDRLCGYRLPDDIQSKSNALYIKFVSDYSVTKHGFLATFQKEVDECATRTHECEQNCVNTPGGYRCECRLGYDLAPDGRRCSVACGGVLRGANGTIVSPEFPDLYPPNKNCVWQIIAPAHHKIMLNFTHFDLEGNNNECEYDFVEVQHVTLRNISVGKRLGLFCGYDLPRSIASSSNMLRVEFKSDNSVQRSGFQATFTVDRDECEENNGGCHQQCVNTLGSFYCACNSGYVLHENGRDCKEGGCHQRITSPYAEVTSPGWPEQYPARKNCVWIFSTSSGHRAKLSFTNFHLESHASCIYDRVELYDGATDRDRKIGAFCKDLPIETPSSITSTGNNLLMLFVSDASVQRQGFRAIYTTICGANLTATSNVQFFYSHPSHGGQDYASRLNCEWVIQAPAEQCVHLRFTMFELENDNDCGYDYVEVYSGSSTSGSSLGKFCGTKVRDVASSGPQMYIRFVSDDTINGKGFAAAYITAECNAAINLRVTTSNLLAANRSKADSGRTVSAKPPQKQDVAVTPKSKQTQDPASVIHGPVFYGNQNQAAPSSSSNVGSSSANVRRSRTSSVNQAKYRTRRPPVDEGFVE